ncbi:MAG: response regulator transcription factor [Desulfovibrio sp.]|jgi:two-component system phosphate regulon response regulator PhoB|nr:response regulator transcription factor [Desulfovibrio sp.]
MEKQTICIIEDEADIRELLEHNIQKAGFLTCCSGDGRQGLELIRAKRPALVLLDVMLPGIDGLEVCKALAKDSGTASIPIIMLTARGEEMDRVVGLELGATDYVVKPFSVRELLLRIRNVLQRASHLAFEDARLSRHGVTLDVRAHKAALNAVALDITATEFRLLENLMRHAGQVRTREQLLNSVWGYHFEGYARTVDTHMRRLRAKMGNGAAVLETVRGVGYRFRE